MREKKRKLQGIAKIIMLSKTEGEIMQVLDDILTGSEVENVHERIKIVACLKKGMSQRETKKITHAGIATITRGSSLIKKTGFILDKMISIAQDLSWWNRLFWRT